MLNSQNGQIVAGLRSGRVGQIRVGGRAHFADTVTMMNTALGRRALSGASHANTVIGVVATDAALSKAQATKVAQMAHDGLARAVRPAHTMLDGDTIFALSTGRKPADVSMVGAFAAEVMSHAILRAVKSADSAGGLPGLKHK